jgi:hypothetical protein
MVTERPRMHRLSALSSAVAALVLFAVSGIACKQGAGDRCEVDSDCSDGLQCLNVSTDRAEGGRCGNPRGTGNGVDAATVDTGGGDDSAAQDTASDQMTTSDAGDAPDDTVSGDASDAAAPSDAVTDSSSDGSAD